MRSDTRLFAALHILLHMEESAGAMTSDTLGPLLKMNPVVLRRTLAGLRDAGIVRAEKGHGGGWALARSLDKVSVAEVYDALGNESLFAIAPREIAPTCLVEQAVNAAIGDALEDAKARLLRRLGALSVADIARDVAQRVRHQPGCRQKNKRSRNYV